MYGYGFAGCYRQRNTNQLRARLLLGTWHRWLLLLRSGGAWPQCSFTFIPASAQHIAAVSQVLPVRREHFERYRGVVTAFLQSAHVAICFDISRAERKMEVRAAPLVVVHVNVLQPPAISGEQVVRCVRIHHKVRM